MKKAGNRLQEKKKGTIETKQVAKNARAQNCIVRSERKGQKIKVKTVEKGKKSDKRTKTRKKIRMEEKTR